MGYIDVIASLVPKLSVAILRSSFTEPSEQVRGTMWRPLLKSLKGKPCSGFSRFGGGVPIHRRFTPRLGD